MVEDVKSLSAKLELRSLSNQEILHHRKVFVRQPGTVQCVPRGISKCILPSPDVRRQRVGGCVNARTGVAVDVIPQAAVCTGSMDPVRTLGPLAHICAVIAESDIEWHARLYVDNAGHLPASESLACKQITTLEFRQRISKGSDYAMAYIPVRIAVVCSGVVLLRKCTAAVRVG